ncbi:phosphatidylinositol-specific phospholipase C domain-containing protein [Kitasatospora nipponensis]|uniref:Phosphatidylinositol-specific phospholipase C domain-containing protein n=1 Tax=Kitasatospora nipponensis TaxID=258049 RepID=A0ABN1WRR7_9ACTN
MTFARVRSLLTAAVLVAPVALLASAGGARADATDALSLAGATTVGVHNTYDQAAYPYLAQALDAGSSLIELDTWVNVFTHKWNVSHSNPLGSNNNCVQAKAPADLYTGNRSQNLDSCLDDLRVWLTAHPGHPPVMLKLEMKNGFDATIGMSPAVLDGYIAQHLGGLVYKPADLLRKADGSSYPDLDTAARAGNWPTRSQLAGKVVIEAIPGTFEQANPFDHLWTDTEYAQHLRDLAAAGSLGSAQIFPSVLGAQAGDPRTRYADAGLRPWFVVFDGDASTYLSGSDTAWYDRNHYLVVATDAQNVAPAIDDTNPTPAQASARVAQLAAGHASFVTSDWRSLTTVLPEVLPRG